MVGLRRAGAVFLALSLLASPAQACRLALLLAFDVSSSVDAGEDLLQRQGMATALRDSAVMGALLDRPEDPVALAAFEWSGPNGQAIVLHWTLLRAPADIDTAARRIETSPRRVRASVTATGSALAFADAMMARAPKCLAQTLDISGDGVHNEGPSPTQIYASGALASTRVNALVVTSGKHFTAPGWVLHDDDDLLAHFARDVIKGPGAFYEEAKGFDDFARAMTRKLQKEVAVQVYGDAR